MRVIARSAIGGLIAASLAFALAAPATLVAPQPAAAVSRDDVEKKQKENAAERKKIEGQLEDTDEKLKSTYLRLSDAQGSLKVARLELQVAQSDYVKFKREADDLHDRLAAAEAEHADLEKQIEANRAKLTAAEDALADIARDTVSDSSMADSSISLLLSAESVDDLIASYQAADAAAEAQQDAIFTLQQEQGTMANQRARLAAVESEIKSLKKKADAKLADAAEAKARAAKKESEIQGLVSKETALVGQLKDAKSAFLAKQKKIDADQKKLDDKLKEIARKEAEAYKKLLEAQKKKREQQIQRNLQKQKDQQKQQDEQSQEDQSDTSGDGSVRVTSGAFGWPVSDPVVTSPFGMRYHPILHYVKLHSGTDFGAACGTPIMAAATGEVLWASYQGAWGNQTAINHGIMGGQPTVTTYNHQSRMLVHAGQVVQRGQLIGYVGTTGYSTGCHLHFEIHKNGVPVNPMSYY